MQLYLWTFALAPFLTQAASSTIANTTIPPANATVRVSGPLAQRLPPGSLSLTPLLSTPLTASLLGPATLYLESLGLPNARMTRGTLSTRDVLSRMAVRWDRSPLDTTRMAVALAGPPVLDDAASTLGDWAGTVTSAGTDIAVALGLPAGSVDRVAHVVLPSVALVSDAQGLQSVMEAIRLAAMEGTAVLDVGLQVGVI